MRLSKSDLRIRIKNNYLQSDEINDLLSDFEESLFKDFENEFGIMLYDSGGYYCADIDVNDYTTIEKKIYILRLQKYITSYKNKILRKIHYITFI